MNKEYYERNRPAILKQRRGHYEENKGIMKWCRIYWKYKLGKNWQEAKKIWMSAFNKQHGLCAICRKRKATETDHCHKTGRFRGILCTKCNRALGAVENNIKAVNKYLSERV